MGVEQLMHVQLTILPHEFVLMVVSQVFPGLLMHWTCPYMPPEPDLGMVPLHRSVVPFPGQF